MYRYREDETALVLERIEEFEDQIARRLSGELSEDAFKPLRLMNGLYLQLHAYMLRVAIPYGTLDTAQLRALAHIAERFDRGYGHFTTRQNLQFNWIALTEVPEILRELANGWPPRHPNLRELHSECHRRPLRRGGGGRTRGQPPLGRTAAPVVDLPP